MSGDMISTFNAVPARIKGVTFIGIVLKNQSKQKKNKERAEALFYYGRLESTQLRTVLRYQSGDCPFIRSYFGN